MTLAIASRRSMNAREVRRVMVRGVNIVVVVIWDVYFGCVVVDCQLLEQSRKIVEALFLFV